MSNEHNDQATLKMHANEIVTDVSVVRHLLKSQTPQWANLTLEPVKSAGTDNAIYRLGNDKAVRLPRIDWATGQIDKEFTWMPELAPHLPLQIPYPIVKGEPDERYPYPWGIYKWLEGENLKLEQVTDPEQAAATLANFLKALQKINTTDAPLAKEHNSRGISLTARDKETRKAISSLKDIIDTKKALGIWELALQADEWNRGPVWFHGDLLVGNLLFKKGELNAVIDFGGLAAGDPSCDLMIAWSLFSGESREVFKQTLEVDDASWLRAKGRALSQAVIFIPYYLETNPVGVAYARHMLNNLFDDYDRAKNQQNSIL